MPYSTMNGTSIRREQLHPDDENQFLKIFAETFAYEPMFSFMLEGRDDLVEDTLWIARRKWLLMKNSYAIWTNDGPHIHGFSWWLPPQAQSTVSLWKQLKVGFALVPLKFGWRRFQRMLECSAHERKILQAATQTPCWVLDVIATEPSMQGQGLGHQMMEPVLELAAQGGHTCYVLTHNERNAGFYEKTGFQMETEERVCANGPMAYGLRYTP
ncbi:MAG: N-acetyltransferase [Deltaproteobacteria bacterium]|nr:MAG: N-acetyltransferase [Deltaproteobacteria bacterium]